MVKYENYNYYYQELLISTDHWIKHASKGQNTYRQNTQRHQDYNKGRECFYSEVKKVVQCVATFFIIIKTDYEKKSFLYGPLNVKCK